MDVLSELLDTFPVFTNNTLVSARFSDSIMFWNGSVFFITKEEQVLGEPSAGRSLNLMMMPRTFSPTGHTGANNLTPELIIQDPTVFWFCFNVC